MRLSVAEKLEIIAIVDRSELGVNRTLKELGIHKSTFYKWYHAYLAKGPDGLKPQKRSRQQWNSIPEVQKQLSTILDDYSRYIVNWKLCKTMKASDVERSVESALNIVGLPKGQRPKLLSDNGACYIAAELKEYLFTKGIVPIHGKVNHPQIQGKIERYHRSMKNVVKLDHYYCSEELVDALERFVNYYNHQRYHESLDNVTPADVYFGKKEQILKRRAKIKQQNMKLRRSIYFTEKLKPINPNPIKLKNYSVT